MQPPSPWKALFLSINVDVTEISVCCEISSKIQRVGTRTQRDHARPRFRARSCLGEHLAVRRESAAIRPCCAVDEGARGDRHHAVALKRDCTARHFCRVISKENSRHREVALFDFHPSTKATEGDIVSYFNVFNHNLTRQAT